VSQQHAFMVEAKRYRRRNRTTLAEAMSAVAAKSPELHASFLARSAERLREARPRVRARGCPPSGAGGGQATGVHRAESEASKRPAPKASRPAPKASRAPSARPQREAGAASLRQGQPAAQGATAAAKKKAAKKKAAKARGEAPRDPRADQLAAASRQPDAVCSAFDDEREAELRRIAASAGRKAARRDHVAALAAERRKREDALANRRRRSSR